jgi:hypothetical protein
MPQVNRTPVVVTALSALPTGKVAGDWKVRVFSPNYSLPIFEMANADPNAIVIPTLDIGTTYTIEVARLDSQGNELSKISSPVLIEQLPGDPVYAAPVSFTLKVG